MSGSSGHKGARAAKSEGGHHPFSQARRLVQVVVILNLFLLSTTVLLPLYSKWRLDTLKEDFRQAESAERFLTGAKLQFVSFYASDALRDHLRVLKSRVSSRLAAEPRVPRDPPAPADWWEMIEFTDLDRDGSIAIWAYACPVVGKDADKRALRNVFVRANEILTDIYARHYGMGSHRDVPVDYVVAFSCAITLVKTCLEHANWRDEDYKPRDVDGGIEVSPFDTLSHDVIGDLGAFLDPRDVLAPLPQLAARANAPIALSVVSDVAGIKADFSAQIVEWRRDQNSASFSIPLVGVSVDARTIEYGAILVMLILLIEAFIFHQSLLNASAPAPATTAAGAAGAPHYFRVLLLSPRAPQPKSAAIAWTKVPLHVLTIALSLVLLFLLLVVPLAVAIFRLWSADSAAFPSREILFPALCFALFALVLGNLIQLYLLERRTMLDGDSGGYLDKP
jgi:hypothetical protein